MSDKDINSIDDELFDVTQPEVPEVSEEAGESTTDKVETQTYEFTSPNAEMSSPTFSPVSEKDRRTKYHIPLAATNYTPKEQSDIVKRPNYTDEDLDYSDLWQETVVNTDIDAIVTDTMYDSLHREDSLWQQRIVNDGRTLAPGRPKLTASGTGERISGIKVISKVQSLLGIGSPIKVPLWHSGIWVSLKAPEDIQLLNFYETIDREKINLGKSTMGLIFSNQASYINRVLFDLVVDCIYETNVKDYENENLRELVSINDLPILAWALAYSIFPNGYSYNRACIENPKECQHVIESTLDINKIMWTDRSALNDKQLKFMMDIPRTLKTVDEIKAYQSEFTDSKFNQYNDDRGFTVVFKTPSVEDHITAGTNWIYEMENVVRSTFTDESDIDNINRYMRERSMLTTLRNYAHYIKHVTFSDDNSIVDDATSIAKFLNQISAAPEVVDDLIGAINKFIDNSAVSMIAVPRNACPECQKVPSDGIDKNPWLLPVNAIKLFFNLRDRKLQQSVQS